VHRILTVIEPIDRFRVRRKNANPQTLTHDLFVGTKNHLAIFAKSAINPDQMNVVRFTGRQTVVSRVPRITMQTKLIDRFQAHQGRPLTPAHAVFRQIKNHGKIFLESAIS
jgi:hypothetical protein